ncbi:hypothetical protein AUJ64_01615 [Candidatus Pacearchaeota archaeon CG1_02_39_14]|nr:MAG: hypothetical protein AUJ64_01615 [Candidatus Pacearchaeota archaeon CG1_02_39_14]
MRKIEKKGLSPVVATVLLVSVVIVLALIIFLWARGFLSERVQKFDSAIELSCDNVDFVAGVTPDRENLDLKNNGNVPIYGVIVKEIGRGSVEVKEVFGSTLNVGESREIDIRELDIGSAERLLVVPILLGKSGSERVSYTCDDSFGYPVEL